MHSDNTSIQIENGLCILSGYAVKVSVYRDRLTLADGACEYRRSARFDRATCGIRRLAIIAAGGGYVSFDALQWLHDIGAGVMVIGHDDAVLMATAPRGLDYPVLRRAQAVAVYTDAGLSVARYLLARKLDGQHENLERLGVQSAVFEDARARFETCQTVETLRAAEAQAAGAYWSAWSAIPVRFARRDVKHIPAHWQLFGTRASAITGHPRSATNPANAVLNYAYSILQGETSIALTAYGLDAGLGVMHADDRNKNGMTYDVMEAARPAVDSWLFDFLARRIFTRDDVWQTKTGVVRLSLALRREITRAAPIFAQSVAPYVERVAEMFTGVDLPAKLTLQRKRTRPAKRPTVRPAESRCRECGAIIPAHRQYCDSCFPAYLTGSIASAHAALSEQRERGEDVAHSPETNRQRGEKNAAHYRENAAFVDRGDIDYARDIAPHLDRFSAREIARATGLSVSYASFIRSGKRIPHARHWRALAALIAP